MTELGMVLSNPLHPVTSRLEGHVGQPLSASGTLCRLVDSETGEVINLGVSASAGGNSGDGSISEDTDADADADADTPAGELRVKGDQVFLEYLNLPQVTKESFDDEGYFKTGDIAVYNTTANAFRILGRSSADIIKHAGYKLSSLEIERELLSCTMVRECAVVGVHDDILGQALVAVVVCEDGLVDSSRADASSGSVDANAGADADTTTSTRRRDICDFLQPRLASYKRRFRHMHFVSEIPRNAMGKVNKKTLLSDLHLPAD